MAIHVRLWSMACESVVSTMIWTCWPRQIYAIGIVAYIPQNPPDKYLTLILRNLGFSTVSLLHTWNDHLIERTNLREVQHKSTHNPVHGDRYIHSSRYHMAQWTTQWTFICIHDPSSLDVTVPLCAALLAWRFKAALAYVCFSDDVAQLSLLSRYRSVSAASTTYQLALPNPRQEDG